MPISWKVNRGRAVAWRGWLGCLCLLCCLLPLERTFGDDLAEGAYTGIWGHARRPGTFRLQNSGEGRLSGTFAMSSSMDPAGDWKGTLELERLEGDLWQASFSATPEFSGNQTILQRFDTPEGEAFIGSFAYDQSGEIWTGYLAIWLKSGLSPAAVGPSVAVSPELTVRYGGRSKRWEADPVGLGSNATRSLYKASDGHLWIGTTDGISRFDGRNWLTYNSETAPELPGWNCRGITEDEEGNIVLMLKHHGFYRLRDGQWEGYECNDYLENKTPSGLLKDGDGNLWFSMDGQQLCRVDTREHLATWGVAELIPLAHPSDTRLPGIGLGAEFAGGVVVGTTGGIRLFRPQFQGLPFWLLPRVDDLSRVVRTVDDELLVTSLSRIVHRDATGKVIETYFPRPHAGTLRHAFRARRGGLWVIGARGLFLMPGPETMIHFADFPIDLAESVTQAIEDDDGNLWVATTGRGLGMFCPTAIEPLMLPAIEDPYFAQRSRPISLSVGPEGGLLLARAAIVSQQRGAEWATLFESGEMEHTVITSVAEQTGSTVWAGIVQVDAQREKALKGLVSLPLPVAASVRGDEVDYYIHQGFPYGFDRVTSILSVEGHGVWLGTNEGVMVCQPDTVISWNDQFQLPHSVVTVLFQDSRDDVWVGMEEGGLYRYRPGSDGLEQYSVGNDILLSDQIRTVAESSRGGLWYAGPEGVFHWDRQSARTSLNATGNLTSVIHAMLEDHEGNLWVGCSTGIFALQREQIDKAQENDLLALRWVRFGRVDGLSNPSIESGHFPAAVATPDGYLCFAMQSEFVRFRPEELLGSLSEGPDVRITAINDSGLESWMDKGSVVGGILQLGYDSPRHVKIDFDALHFSEPELLSFRYRLAARGADWTEIGSQRSVWLFDLSPGEYLFEVEAKDKNGVLSPRPARLPFRVLPRFYETTLFRVAGLSGVLALLWWGHHRKVRRTMEVEEMKGQLRLESDRRRIAQDMHDEIGASFAQLKILGELVESKRVEGEEQSKSVSRMVTLARSGSQTLREILWALDSADIEGEDLPEFLGATIENLLDGTGIALSYDHEWLEPIPKLSPRFKREVLLLAKGVVSNVIRHAHAENFRCELKGQGSRVHLLFQDDGVGFDPTTLSSDTLGMQSLEQRVARWGGQLKVTAVPDQGVKLEMTLDASAGDVVTA